MGDAMKWGLAVLLALAVGFGGGYVVGRRGAADLKQHLSRSEKALAAARQAISSERSERERAAADAVSLRRTLEAQVAVARALVELYAGNFGLASQHLGTARARLKALAKGAAGPLAKALGPVKEKLDAAQALVLRFDPMARVSVEKLLAAVGRLPGAR